MCGVNWVIGQRSFNGDRLRMARIYRGLTSAELAERLEITKQAIYQLENGKNSPKLETLLRLSSELQFPREFFYQHDPRDRDGQSNVFFRAQLTTQKIEQLSQLEKMKVLAKIHGMLEHYVDFPALDVPPISLEDERPDCEEIANRVRKAWSLGDAPIENAVRLLERHGFIVTSLPVSTTQIDAFSMGQELEDRTCYYVVLGSNKNSAVRRQFDATHELGHCVLHHGSVNSLELGKEEHREIESEANRFAAAFLLPEEAFLSDLIYPNKLDFYLGLKKRWKVSISAMIVRAFHLNAINANQYHYLMRQMTRRGWRQREPLDDELKLEQPTVLPKAVELILSSGTLTASEFLAKLADEAALSLNRQDVETLLGLSTDTLVDETQNSTIISLKPKAIAAE